MEFEKGVELSPNPYVKTTPRRWTESEIEYMLQLKEEGKSLKEICNILDRSIASVQVKLKRLKKKDGSYNQKHSSEKNEINLKYVEYLKPKTILDLYSGGGEFSI